MDLPFRRQTYSLQRRPAWVLQRAERGQYLGEVLRGSCRPMKLSRRAGESWPIDAHGRDLGRGGVLWISQARKSARNPQQQISRASDLPSTFRSPVVWEHRDSAVATRAFAVRPPIGPSSSLLCDHCTHCQRPCPGRSFRDRHLTLLREAVKLATSTNGFLQRQSVVQVKVRREETPYSCAVTCVVEDTARV